MGPKKAAFAKKKVRQTSVESALRNLAKIVLFLFLFLFLFCDHF